MHLRPSIRTSPLRRSHLLAGLVAALAWAVAAAPACAQDDGDGMEEFDEEDPYTAGSSALVSSLGYRSMGNFAFLGPHRTETIQLEMGGVPMLFVETEHFRIGSTLTTYKYTGDREEKAKLGDELDQFEERLEDFKPVKKKKLDPWLRLHLAAQRAENLFAEVVEVLGIEPDDWKIWGPHMGQRGKPVIVLCQRESEYGRFMRRFVQAEADLSYRWYLDEGGLGVALNREGLADIMRADDDTPMDTAFHCSMVHAVTSNLIDGYRRNNGGRPYWLANSLSHMMVRRVDPRFVVSFGLREGETIDEDDYKWEPRVRNLVKNDFFASAEEMFGWLDYGDLDKRDHMVAWSKLEFLLTELEGDRGEFVNAICGSKPSGDDEAVRAAQVERQVKALDDYFELTPTEFDEAWAAWVKKTYKKR